MFTLTIACGLLNAAVGVANIGLGSPWIGSGNLFLAGWLFSSVFYEILARRA